MIHTLSQTTKQIIFLAVIIFGLLAYSFMNASWTPPPATPPNENTLPPINVGTTSIPIQAGVGALQFDILSARDTVSANVEMRSPSYCNADGTVCSDPSTGNNKSGIFRCSHAESMDSTNIPCHSAAFPSGVASAQRHYLALMCYDYPLSGTYTSGQSIAWSVGRNQWYWFNRYGNWGSCGDGVIVIDIGSVASIPVTYAWGLGDESACYQPDRCSWGTSSTTFECKHSITGDAVEDSNCTGTKPTPQINYCSWPSGGKSCD